MYTDALKLQADNVGKAESRLTDKFDANMS
jgi:hypothetical protein